MMGDIRVQGSFCWFVSLLASFSACGTSASNTLPTKPTFEANGPSADDYGLLDPTSPAGRALAHALDFKRPPTAVPDIPTLSDEDLRSLEGELRGNGHSVRMQKIGYGTRIVARHRNAKVAVTITCADICPFYTHAELTYKVPETHPAAIDANACIAVGGVVIERGGMMAGSYCYPGVLHSPLQLNHHDSSKSQTIEFACKSSLDRHPELTEINRHIMLKTCEGT